MKTINIRDVYPDCNRDCLIQVLDEQYEEYKASLTWEAAEIYIEFARMEEAWERKCSRYGAFYSLDYRDGIERHAVSPVPSPQQILEASFEAGVLYTAFESLTETQGRRIYAYFFLGWSKARIARSEGVAQRTVGQTIERALANLRVFYKR